MVKLPHGTSGTGRTTGRQKKTGVIDLKAGAVKTRVSSGASKNPNREGASEQAKSVMAATIEAQPDAKERIRTSRASMGGKTGKKNSSGLSDSTTMKPVHNHSGFFRVLTAGIAGGLIAFAGLLSMQYAGFSFSSMIMGEKRDSASPVLPLQSQLANLQSEMERLKNSFTLNRNPVPTKEDFSLLESTVKNTADDSVRFQMETDARLQELTKSLDTLRNSTDNLTAFFEKAEGSNLMESLHKTSARVESLERNFTSLTTEVDKRVNQLDERLQSIVVGEKLSQSVTLSALKASIDRGEKFSDILSSLEILMGPSRKLDLLKPYALTGVPTVRALLEEFRILRGDMIMASTNNPDAGIGEHLLSSFRSLITVSSTEALSGNSPGAILSRIEANLKAGKPILALSEWETLPNTARKVSGLWAERLMRRIKINRDISIIMQVIRPDNQGNGHNP